MKLGEPVPVSVPTQNAPLPNAAPPPAPRRPLTILLQLLTWVCVLAVMAGGGLALSGLAYQTLFRNSLAEPYTLGVASGAALGAVTALRFESVTQPLGLSVVALASFAGQQVAAGILAAQEAPDTASFTTKISSEGALAVTEANDVAAFVVPLGFDDRGGDRSAQFALVVELRARNSAGAVETRQCVDQRRVCKCRSPMRVLHRRLRFQPPRRRSIQGRA